MSTPTIMLHEISDVHVSVEGGDGTLVDSHDAKEAKEATPDKKEDCRDFRYEDDLILQTSSLTWWSRFQHVRSFLPRWFQGMIGFNFLAAACLILGCVLYYTMHAEKYAMFQSSNTLLGLGVLSSLIGSLQTASGYACHKIVHRLLQINSHLGSTWQQPLYQMGLALLVVGSIAAVINLGILGESVTAPFAALTLMYNALLARYVLQEQLTKWDLYSSVLVMIGVSTAVTGVSLAHLKTRHYQMHDILMLYTSSFGPVIFSLLQAILLLALPYYVHKNKKENSSLGLFTYSICGGMLSGLTSLSIKSTIEINNGMLHHHTKDYLSPWFYLFPILIVVFISFQLHFMNKGLQHFGACKFVPLYHAFIIVFSMIDGMVYFAEAKEYNALSLILFFIGCCITVLGVGLLLAKFDTIKQIHHATRVSSDNIVAVASMRKNGMIAHV